MSRYEPFLTTEVPDPAREEDELLEQSLTEDDLYETLEDESSPGEASRDIDAAEPLTRNESEIVDDPSFRGIDRVDDPLHDDFVRRVVRRGQRGLDAVLDDAVYGDTMTKEERLERTGSDDESGWSIPGLSFIKKVATAPISLARKIPGVSYVDKLRRKIPGMSYVDKFARAPFTAAQWAKRKTFGLVKKFVPRRDVNKAKIVRNLNRKLVVEHANWLANQDQRTGRPVQPISYYRSQSRPWARQQIRAAGLPTSFKVTGADVLGAEFVGEDVMGVWWNPFSWFTQTTQVVIDRTKMERSETGPDGQPAPGPDVSPEANPEAYEPSPEEAAAPDAYDPSAEAQGDDLSGDDGTSGISGEDSLGAFAAEIMGASPLVPRDPVAVLVRKMRTGQPLSPGDVALLATSAKTDARARHAYRLLVKRGKAVSVSGDDDSGAWAHKLNPFYWFKSRADKELIDKEKERWIANAETRKKLEQLEKTKAASEAALLAKQQAAATEAQLAAIESSMKGAFVGDEAAGDVLGHEKPTAISKLLATALEKVGKRTRASEIYAKVLRGDTLSSDELKDARTIAKVVGRVKVVHGDLYQAPDPQLSALHGAFVGACLAGQVEAARRRNQDVGALAVAVERHLAAGKPLTPKLAEVVSGLCRETARMRGCVRSHTSGRAYAGLVRAPELRKTVTRAAAKAAMTEAEKKMLKAIQDLAKAGNPRAVEALKKMRATGTISGGDHVDVGFSLSKAFSYVMKPVTYPLKKLGQGLKWTGQKLGIVSKGGSASPEQVRLNMLRAAANRQRAAQAKLNAANAQTEAELRAQNAIAAAAEAEAEAQEAEAAAREAAMMTKEAEANPETARAYAQADTEADSSGDFTGGWVDYAGAEDKKLLAAAAEKSPAGGQLRAGAKLYRKVLARDPEATAAVTALVGRAKRGEPQARRDLAAVKAGRKAVLAKKKAQRKQVRALVRRARAAKVRAFQRKLEARVADKLVRVERKVMLSRASVVERKATAGNKRAKKYVAAQVTLAKRGDKKAVRKVAMLKLARKVRVAAPTRRERRNLAVAQSVVAKARRGNRKAVRQVYLIQSAAKGGNPNAKRALKRLEVASSVLNVVAAGTPLARRQAKQTPKTGVASVEQRAALARAKSRRSAGVATREELAAGARAAEALGDRKAAGELALAATTAPSATLALRNAAAVVAAKEAGNPEAVQAVSESFADAKKGDAEAIKQMSGVMAAQTVADVNEGKPVSAAVRDAANLQARIEAGDPAAINAAKQIAQAATEPNPVPEATAAAIALGAAAATSRALAAKPKAKAEYMARVNDVPADELPAAEARLNQYLRAANDGTISPADGAAAVKLAERVGKPKVAAEIAAKAPPAPEPSPLSSTPDLPLAPVRGALGLVKESVRALTFSTRDPLQNYREGVASRGSSAAPSVSGGEPVDALGWSPFTYFKKLLPVFLPGVAAAASTASMVMNLQKKSAPKPTPKPVPAAPPETPQAVPAAPAAEPVKVASEEASSSGADDAFATLVKAALKSKKMSRADFNKAIDAHVDPKADKAKKLAAAEKTLAFLTKRKVTVEK